MITLTPNAEKNSSYIVVVSLFDENGDPVLAGAVTEISWTLRDSTGTVINGRLDIPVTPAQTFTIVLSGADLAMPDSTIPERSLAIICTYNSVEFGELALAEELVFSVNNLMSGGNLVLPAKSNLCLVTTFCYDECGQLPRPSVKAGASLVNDPVFHEGKLLKTTVFSANYNPDTGLISWYIPRNVTARIYINETGFDHEVKIPDTATAKLEDLTTN